MRKRTRSGAANGDTTPGASAKSSENTPVSVAHSVGLFLGTGALSYVVDVSILAITYSVLHFPLWLSASTGFWAAFLVNFGLNRQFTFRSRGLVRHQLLKYTVLVVANYILTILFVGLAEVSGIGYLIGKTAAVTLLMIVNYIGYRVWVFR